MTDQTGTADTSAHDALDYFRTLQEKREARESGGRGRYRGSLALVLLVIIAGAFTVWTWHGSVGNRPFSIAGATLLTVVFSSILLGGLVMVSAARPRRAATRVVVDGTDLSVSQPGRYVTGVLSALALWPMSVVMIWMAEDADDLFPGGVATHYALSALMAVLPLVFLAITAGGSELTVRGHTLTYRAGVLLSGTVRLSPYIRTHVITVKGTENMTISVYPATRVTAFGIPRTSRHLSIPGLAFPEISLHAVAALVDHRSTSGKPSVALGNENPFPQFQLRSLVVALGIEAALLAATVQVGWVTAPVAAFLGLALALPLTSVIPRASILRPEVTGATDDGARFSVTCGYGGLVLTPVFLLLTVVSVTCAPRALSTDDFATSLTYGGLSLGAGMLLVTWSARSFGATRVSADEERIVVTMGALFHAEVAIADIRTIEREVTLWPRLRVFTDGHVSVTILGHETTRRSIVVGAPFLHGVHVADLASSLMRRKVTQQTPQRSPEPR